MAENTSHWLDEALLPFAKLLFNLFLDLLKKGYCKPAELQEAEEAGETFEAGEDAGMGEGQGTKDVSDQIEDESQVEGTQNEKKEEQESVKEEKEGLDMNEDFEGALEDVEKEEEEGEEGDEDEDQEKEEQDEQMGDVDDAEDQDKKQTFGDDDDELPDDKEPENSEGAQSKEQPELAAKEEELEKEKGQKLHEEGEEEEEEEDPNEEAGEAGQMQDDMMDEETQDLPEDLDLGDMDEEDGGPEDADNLDEDEEGEEEEETAEPMEEGGDEDQEEDNAEEETASAALPDQQETPAEGTNSAAESIAQPSTSDDQTAEREEEGKETGAEQSKGGDSTALPSAPEEVPKPELKRQTPDEEPRQQAESSKAKRLKTVPRKESKQAELKDVNVFEHTEEGEDAEEETMDTAKDNESRADMEMIHDEEEEKEEESENVLEEDEKEEEVSQTKLSKQNDVQDVKLEELRLEEEGQEEEKMESDAMKDESPSYYNTPDLVSQKEQITELRRKAMERRKSSTSIMTAEEAKATWGSYEAITAPLAQELCEQLRLILTPTKAAKLKGDYRSGKRLNMKKVIPYIASQFQKDKIWLRRTKPSAREYQVMVALDDSASMGESQSIQMSLEAVAALCSAMTKLDVGQVGVCGFGDDPSLILPFSEPFTSTAGARVVQHFSFQQQNTDIVKLLDSTTQHFADSSAQSRAGPLSQLLFIISDGRGLFLKGVDAVKKSVKEAWDAGIFIVFLIVDQHDSKESILNIRTPVFDKSGKLLRIEPYLDTFPFPYYVVLRKAEELPHTLTDALRQWVEMVSTAD